MAYEQITELETPSFGGVNTASQFSLIPREQSPRMQNAYMDEIGDISQRPGTIPVTSQALGSPIGYLTTYKSSANAASAPEIYASSGSTLYKFDGANVLNGLSMTNLLTSPDIYALGFTNAALVATMIIGDGSSLKQCDGAIVKNVTPAANDTSPAPANALNSVNTKGCKFVFTYSGHVFISPGTNELFYTKRYTFDYVPSTQFFYIVNNNDYINGCGLGFDSVCLVPLRRSWAVISGVNFDSFDASKFLNTSKGVIAPRSIDRITYPSGEQTIVFLSDDEVHEIYIAIVDGGGRVYSTRSIMQDRIDFSKVGLTEAEKAAAVGYFDNNNSRYHLSFKKSGVNYTWVYDARNKQWYTDWLTFNAKSYVSLGGITYFAGSTGHLHRFDAVLNSDWDDAAKTTKTPVCFKRYSPAISLEFSGFDSFFDAYLVESKQWTVTASLDITFVFSNKTETIKNAVINQAFIEGSAIWGFAKYINTMFTDYLNEPNEIIFDYSQFGRYCQIIWSNDRDEPVKIYKDRIKGRISGR